MKSLIKKWLDKWDKQQEESTPKQCDPPEFQPPPILDPPITLEEAKRSLNDIFYEYTISQMASIEYYKYIQDAFYCLTTDTKGKPTIDMPIRKFNYEYARKIKWEIIERVKSDRQKESATQTETSSNQ